MAHRNPVRRTRAPLGAACALSLALLLGACGGSRGLESTGPELTPSRLGGLRCAMTYDGDWLGGMPSAERIPEDLELASRRGVEVVLDLRSPAERAALPLDVYADALGLSLVHTNRTLKAMVGEGLIRWRAGRMQPGDETRLRDIAEMEPAAPSALPLI